MELKTERWLQKSFPDLIQARYWHVSCSVGEQIYVAGGDNHRHKMLSSIEIFRLGTDAWVLIDIPDLTPRVLPVFT